MDTLRVYVQVFLSYYSWSLLFFFMKAVASVFVGFSISRNMVEHTVNVLLLSRQLGGARVLRNKIVLARPFLPPLRLLFALFGG